MKNVYIHAFLDGRDVAPQSSLEYLETLEKAISDLNYGAIATVSGRFYAMDRDKRWERVEKAYKAIVSAEGEKFEDPIELVKASYANNKMMNSLFLLSLLKMANLLQQLKTTMQLFSSISVLIVRFNFLMHSLIKNGIISTVGQITLKTSNSLQ